MQVTGKSYHFIGPNVRIVLLCLPYNRLIELPLPLIVVSILLFFVLDTDERRHFIVKVVLHIGIQS